MRGLLSAAGLEVVAEYGVRVVSDYLPEKLLNDPDTYERLLRLEQKLGGRAEFATIARYTQVIAGIGGGDTLPKRQDP